MKAISPLLLLLLLLLLIETMIHPSHSITDTQLQSICSQTLNASFCMQVLKSDPRTATADPPGLVTIAVELARSKAYAALSLVQSLESNATDPVLKERLQICSGYYASGRSLLNRAWQSLKLKDYVKVANRASSASWRYEDCEDQFEARPPVMPAQLEHMNDDMDNLCYIVYNVVGQKFK